MSTSNASRQMLSTKPRHPLLDVDEPNLMRDMFPYDEVPKTMFDGEVVDVRPAREIWMTDTTFRDGQQARPPFTVEREAQEHAIDEPVQT